MKWKMKRTAFKIEWIWWKIHRLRREKQYGADGAAQRANWRIAVYRYEAEQLSCLYEVLAGIRPVGIERRQEK